jgi:hypothetical protein
MEHQQLTLTSNAASNNNKKMIEHYMNNITVEMNSIIEEDALDALFDIDNCFQNRLTRHGVSKKYQKTIHQKKTITETTKSRNQLRSHRQLSRRSRPSSSSRLINNE